MGYTGDPVNNPLDRVRIYCTDTDNDDLLIEDSILAFFLQESDGNEKKAALKALGYLLFQIAKMGDEKVGGVYLKNSERIKNLQLVLNDLKKQLATLGGCSLYAGGISITDVKCRRNSWDSIKKPTNTGDAFAMDVGEAYYAQDTFLESNDAVIVVGEYNGETYCPPGTPETGTELENSQEHLCESGVLCEPGAAPLWNELPDPDVST